MNKPASEDGSLLLNLTAGQLGLGLLGHLRPPRGHLAQDRGAADDARRIIGLVTPIGVLEAIDPGDPQDRRASSRWKRRRL